MKFHSVLAYADFAGASPRCSFYPLLRLSPNAVTQLCLCSARREEPPDRAPPDSLRKVRRRWRRAEVGRTRAVSTRCAVPAMRRLRGPDGDEDSASHRSPSLSDCDHSYSVRTVRVKASRRVSRKTRAKPRGSGWRRRESKPCSRLDHGRDLGSRSVVRETSLDDSEETPDQTTGSGSDPTNGTLH